MEKKIPKLKNTAANAASKREYSLADLERENVSFDGDMARAKEQSDELAKAISDFKKL